MAIIAACASVIIGILCIMGFVAWTRPWPFRPSSTAFGYLFSGIFGTIAFAVSLPGGIMSLKRKRFALAIFGVCFVLFEGFVVILASALVPYGVWVAGVILGLPLIVLSILGLIFIAVAKEEFA